MRGRILAKIMCLFFWHGTTIGYRRLLWLGLLNFFLAYEPWDSGLADLGKIKYNNLSLKGHACRGQLGWGCLVLVSLSNTRCWSG